MARLVDHDNHRRYHESINNRRLPMATSGAGQQSRRNERIRPDTIRQRRFHYLTPSAKINIQMSQTLSQITRPRVSSNLTTYTEDTGAIIA
jgi:hypothetical protein